MSLSDQFALPALVTITVFHILQQKRCVQSLQELGLHRLRSHYSDPLLRADIPDPLTFTLGSLKGSIFALISLNNLIKIYIGIKAQDCSYWRCNQQQCWRSRPELPLYFSTVFPIMGTQASEPSAGTPDSRLQAPALPLCLLTT